MKTVLAVLLCLNFFTPSANSSLLSQEDCPDTDIRDHHPHLKEYFSRAHSQGPSNWCYAFSAADLLTVEAGKVISPAHVSALSNEKTASSLMLKLQAANKMIEGTSVIDNGRAKEVLEWAMESDGLCSENNLPYTSEKVLEIRELIKKIQEIKSSFERRLISEERACELLEMNISKSVFGGDKNQEKIFLSLLKNDLNIALKGLVENACKGELVRLKRKKIIVHRKPLPLRRNATAVDKKVYGLQMENYTKGINDVLSAGRPLVIDYDLEAVSNQQSGAHSSVIMARRWINNRCEFKIRNSSGIGCSGFKEEIECASFEGAYWISDSELFDMAFRIISVQD